MKKEQGFTLMELLVAVFGVAGVVLFVYVVYLIICALQKYINS